MYLKFDTILTYQLEEYVQKFLTGSLLSLAEPGSPTSRTKNVHNEESP